ncbi:MAG: hydantoinase/oxoprolinase family protein [Fidelibacterota bacterium]
MKLGVDTGGTFTDFIFIDGGKLGIKKLPSTPENPSHAVFEGIEKFERRITSIIHGSTVAANALLERKGSKVALLTTSGFEDIIEIGRQNRSAIYDLFVRKPPVLVPGEMRFGIRERVNSRGEVIVKASLNNYIKGELLRMEAESVAVCFLFSYLNPENENAVVEELRKSGVKIPICASHEILPEFREYERFSTTVVNSYLLPVMERYLSHLENEFKGKILRVMQSNGGSVSSATAKYRTVNTILSGPAAGIKGAFEVSKLAGYSSIISFDMGGTSTDVSLCPGYIQTSAGGSVGGCPVGVEMIDIHSVGAGGGSIAYFDEGGVLKVGPESAGADPGPVCYGKGGKHVTVTDANLFLGRLDRENFLGGEIQLDYERSQMAIREMAEERGMDPVKLSMGIIKVANINMLRAIRVISVEKGFDPRDFILVTFGGAGPMHACELSEALSIPRVLVPKNAGVLSALGTLFADVVRSYSLTLLMLMKDETCQLIESEFRSLEEKALKDMLKEDVNSDQIDFERFLDMRYLGQSHELKIEFGKDVLGRFHSSHQKIYGYSDTEKAVEIVNIRLRATARVDKPEIKGEVSDLKPTSKPAPSAVKCQNIYFSEGFYMSPIYNREHLGPGDLIYGPALINEYSATTLLPPDYKCSIDRFGNLIIDRKDARSG